MTLGLDSRVIHPGPTFGKNIEVGYYFFLVERQINIIETALAFSMD